MGSGATKNYKFGQKNNWRRQAWNELTCRILKYKKPSAAIILYLAGQQDLDRKIAIDHGFHPDNLIIIERNKDNIKTLRQQAKIVIQGDLIDILAAWKPDGLPIDIIYADLCCGIEPRTIAIYRAIANKPCFWGANVLINFQRGRDARFTSSKEKGEIDLIFPEIGKHRGKLYLAYSIFVYSGGNRAILTAEIPRHYPCYLSYQSGSLCMDSIIFKIPEKEKPRSVEEERIFWEKIKTRLFAREQRIGIESIIEKMDINEKKQLGKFIIDNTKELQLRIDNSIVALYLEGRILEAMQALDDSIDDAVAFVLKESQEKNENYNSLLRYALNYQWPNDDLIDTARKHIAAGLAIRTMKLTGQIQHSPCY